MLTQSDAQSRVSGIPGVSSVFQWNHPSLTGGRDVIRINVENAATLNRVRECFTPLERADVVVAVSSGNDS
jgi:hypothetical protein